MRSLQVLFMVTTRLQVGCDQEGGRQWEWTNATWDARLLLHTSQANRLGSLFMNDCFSDSKSFRSWVDRHN